MLCLITPGLDLTEVILEMDHGEKKNLDNNLLDDQKLEKNSISQPSTSTAVNEPIVTSNNVRLGLTFIINIL